MIIYDPSDSFPFDYEPNGEEYDPGDSFPFD